MPAFLDLPDEHSDPTRARFAVLPIPYEGTTTYGQGTKGGPRAILEASTQVELYDEELEAEPYQNGITTLPEVVPHAADPEAAVKTVRQACSAAMQQGKFVVGLGGEHTVTVGLVEAMHEKFPGMSVLQLDAHSDLRDSYQGSRYNHACVMARVSGICPFVGVGIRSAIPDEKKNLGVNSRIFYAHELRQSSNWQAEVVSALGDPLYITIDLDFFDPAIVPAVGTPEPGGFFWDETLQLLRAVARSRRIIGFDVVELSPRPGWPASDFLAAKLTYKLMGYILRP